MVEKPKQFPRFENVRNREHVALFERLVKLAYGDHNAVIVGHHIVFERTDLGSPEANLATVNEIPSADTLLFDHELMGAVFGPNALMIMQSLASAPPEQRDDLALHYLEALQQ